MALRFISDKRIARFTGQFSVAIITGGSSGIGRALIGRLLHHNPDLLICNVSRSIPDGFSIFSPDKDAEDVRRLHFACDLSDRCAVEQIAECLRELLLRQKGGKFLLVNNSGFGCYGPFSEIPLEPQLNLLDVNIRAMVDLTGRLMPQLRASGGAVINVASTAAFQPTPQLATYGASKAFVLNWSLALAEDCRPQGVSVLAVCPGPTATDFFRRAGFTESPLPAGLGQTADEVADQALRALVAGRWFVVTGWTNKFLTAFARLLPRTLLTRLSGVVLRKVRSGT